MLKELFGHQQRKTVVRQKPSLASLQAKVIGLVNNLPTLPDTATRAMAVANDASTSLAEFAEVIESDPGLAASILRLANSALFCIGAPVMNIHQATLRLGTRQCQHLMVAVGMRGLFRKLSKSSQVRCEALWLHSFTTASICRLFNHTFRLGFDGEEYVGGLLHDLGRMLIALADADAFADAGGMDFQSEGGALQREREVLGTDHCALGAWFAEQNKLPIPVVRCIRQHHEIQEETASRGLVALVALADHMANYLQINHDVSLYQAEQNPALDHFADIWGEVMRKRIIGQTQTMLAQLVSSNAHQEEAF